MSNISVLFVCLGNICRSPTAEGVFRKKVAQAGLTQAISIDSAGTGDWHIGHPPDSRAGAAAGARGFPIDDLQARQVSADDFSRFDYVLAMDRANLSDLQALCPEDYTGHLSLFLDFLPGNRTGEVPDPYYGGANGFEQVLDLVESAADGLLSHIREKHSL